MAAKARIAYTFIGDGATVTSSSETSTLPDTNVVDDRIQKVWRTNGSENPKWVKFDLGSAQAITVVAIFNHTVPAGTTVTLYGHTSDLGSGSWAGADFNTALTFQAYQMVTFFTSTSKRWWRLDFATASNFDIGRIILDGYTEFTTNPTENYRKQRVDPSLSDGPFGAQVPSFQKRPYWTMEFALAWISATFHDTLITIYDTVGIREPILFALDPDNHPQGRAWTWYCRFASGMAFQGEVLDQTSLGFNLQELI